MTVSTLLIILEKNRYKIMKKKTTLFCRLHTQSIFLIFTRIIGRIHSHSGQSKRGALWDAW